MSNLKLIEALCQLVEEQSSIICLLSLTLAEAGVYCEDIDQKILDAPANTPPSSVPKKRPTIYLDRSAVTHPRRRQRRGFCFAKRRDRK